MSPIGFLLRALVVFFGGGLVTLMIADTLRTNGYQGTAWLVVGLAAILIPALMFAGADDAPKKRS